MGGIGRFGRAALVLLVMLLCGCGGGGDGSTTASVSTATTTSTRELTPAEKLATYEKPHATSPNAPVLQTFEKRLASLDAKCTENERLIGGLVLTTQRVMSSRGLDEPPSQVISQLDTAVPNGSNQYCRRAFAAYAISRTR